MKYALFRLNRALWQYQPGAHDPNPPINLADLPALENLWANSEGIKSLADCTGATISYDSTVSPDGLTTADTLIEDSSTGSHQIDGVYPLTFAENNWYTGSIYAKRGAGSRNLSVYMAASDGKYVYAEFDLGTGAVGYYESNLGASLGSFIGIQKSDQGFYRVWFSAQFAAATTLADMALEIRSGSGLSYTGDGSSSLALWGLQVNRGIGPATYIKTVAKFVSASPGSYAITGSAATLKTGKLIAATSGTYTITGSAVTLTKATPGRSVVADAGAYSLTGSIAALKRGLLVTAASGTYALTGTAATLKRGRLVAATAGSYAITGATASLVRGIRISLTAGAYTVTGTTATLKRGLVLVAAPGAYSVTGSAVTLKRGLKVAATAGSYAITGAAVTLTKTGAIKVLVADAGAYTITGQPATLTYVSTTPEPVRQGGGTSGILARKQRRKAARRPEQQTTAAEAPLQQLPPPPPDPSIRRMIDEILNGVEAQRIADQNRAAAAQHAKDARIAAIHAEDDLILASMIF